MDRFEYRFLVQAEDQSIAGRAAQFLADGLLEQDGVFDVQREKDSNATMDLGTIVTAVATSGATLALAQGIAAWLRARRGVTITIEKKTGDASIKAAVANVDPSTAIRITEIVGRRLR